MPDQRMMIESNSPTAIARHWLPSIKPIILLGIALGGMVDGILLHQLLQWHHVISHAAPTISHLKWMIWADGLFHGGTYLLLIGSGVWIWRVLLKHQLPWSTRQIVGGLLSGWGLFNLIEGLINHYLLGIHHVNETVAPNQWYWWDAGFVVWGILMAIGGMVIVGKAKQ